MSNSPRSIETPGAGFTDDETPEQRRIAELEDELRRVRASLAPANSPSGGIEIDTPHGEAAKAASKHLHMTAAEALAAGVDRVVLCKDGWHVPPTTGGRR